MKEGTPWGGEFGYLDVSKEHWSSQYIAYIDQRGLLEPLR